MSDDRELWIWLTLVMQPHSKKARDILKECGNDVLEACRTIRDGKTELTDIEKRRAREIRSYAVNEVLRICAKNNVKIISCLDSDYPQMLNEIPDPPTVLFAAGDTSCLNAPLSISCVGARKVSEYGKEVIDKVCRPLASMGIVIVSGMAVGSDTAAHCAALSVGGKTVGVLGCGILVNYPAENAQLKREIVSNGGCIISELLPLTRTSRGSFSIRNRMISGLSRGVLIAEAGIKSGALITATHAFEQGRDVFCVPTGDIFRAELAGTTDLIRAGAKPVFGYADIIDSYFDLDENERKRLFAEEREKLFSVYNNHDPKNRFSYLDRLRSRESADLPRRETGYKPNIFPSSENPERAEKSAQAQRDISELPENKRKIIELLKDAPADTDTLIAGAGADYSEMTQMLMELEIAGYITLSPDGFYRIK